MEGFIPQALSNMAWGCATLRHSNPRFLETLARSAEARLPEFQPQTLSNMLWAFSTLSIYPEGLFLAAAGELVARFESRDGGADFRAQELSNILIAYARGSILHKGLMAAFEGVMRERLAEEAGPRRRGAQPSDFTPQAMSNSLWAYAALRWYPARLLPTITRAMGGVVQLMSTQEIANSLWAFARWAPLRGTWGTPARLPCRAVPCRAVLWPWRRSPRLPTRPAAPSPRKVCIPPWGGTGAVCVRGGAAGGRV